MFKVGDKIRCNSSSLVSIKKDNVYVVTSIPKDFRDPHVRVIDDNGDTQLYYSHFFELAERVEGSIVTIKDPKPTKTLTLPTDSEARKQIPMFSGCIKYFPAAIAGVAKISKAGNDKHNPGQELHHDRSKSLDHADCIVRHLADVADLIAALERGDDKNPEQILAEVSSLAWRALAYSQTLHEKYDGAPLAPGAK